MLRYGTVSRTSLSSSRKGETRRQSRLAGNRHNPKRAKMTGRFCTYGRVSSEQGSSQESTESDIFIVSIGGNQNSNWRF